MLTANEDSLLSLSLDRITLFSEEETTVLLINICDHLRGMPTLEKVSLSWICLKDSTKSFADLGDLLSFKDGDSRDCAVCKETNAPKYFNTRTCEHFGWGRDGSSTNVKEFLECKVDLVAFPKAFRLNI